MSVSLSQIHTLDNLSSSSSVFPGIGHQLGRKEEIAASKEEIDLILIRSLADFVPIQDELLSIISDEEFQKLDDPLTHQIYQLAARLFSISQTECQKDIFEKIKSCFTELRDEILTSRINPERKPVRLTTPIIVRNVTILKVEGPRRDYLPSFIPGTPLVWEEKVFNAFQKGQLKCFEDKAKITPPQVTPHIHASKIIALVNKVQFLEENRSEDFEFTASALQLLEDLEDIGSIEEPLSEYDARALFLNMLRMSLVVYRIAYDELVTVSMANWERKAARHAQWEIVYGSVADELKLRAIQLEMEHEQQMDQIISRITNSYQAAIQNLSQEMLEEKSAIESIQIEQRQLEAELPELDARSESLKYQAHQMRVRLAERKAEIQRYAEARRQAEYGGFRCIIL